MRTTPALFLMLLLCTPMRADQSLLHFDIDPTDRAIEVEVHNVQQTGCPAVPSRLRSRQTELFAARIAVELGRVRQGTAQLLLDRTAERYSTQILHEYETALREAEQYLDFAHKIAIDCNDGLLRAEVRALRKDPPAISQARR